MIRKLLSAAAAATSLLTTLPADAAFHLWEVQEIYTDSSGTLQFIELFNSSNFEHFVAGQEVKVTNVGETQTNQFTFPSNLNTGIPTAGRTFLMGTASLQAAGGPAPDFIIPDNFLFVSGGEIDLFFGTSQWSYTALPTDGLLSRDWASGMNNLNSPKNFAGQVGVVPEPTTLVLGASSAVCLMLLAWRRRTARLGTRT